MLTGDDLPWFWAIAGEATRPSVHTAPLIIIPLSCQRMYIDADVRRDPSWADPSRWPMPWWHVDTAMAALLILFTVVDEGLAAVYFGIVDHETRALRAEFGIPDDHQPIGVIAIGHGGETERASPAARRRPLAEMIHYGQW